MIQKMNNGLSITLVKMKQVMAIYCRTIKLKLRIKLAVSIFFYTHINELLDS